MARFLLITWNGGGNVPPMIGIAQQLRARGHTVTIAGYASQQGHILERGFAFSLLDPQAKNWMDAPPEQRLQAEIAVWVCPDHLQQVPEALARQPVDAVLVDCMLHGALAALESLNLPYAVLAHSTCGSFDANSAFDRFLLGPINALRSQAGRPAVGSTWESWSRARVICATLPELDAYVGQLPPSFEYVGPIFEQVPPSGWQSPWPAGDPRPLVLVSFSTHSQWDETSRINRTLAALADEPLRVLVTSGMADPQGILQTGNSAVLPYLPHDEVLPEVRLAVIHAGHGSVTKCLAHGVPMVCLPNQQSDQPGLAARVQALGAGLALDGDRATAEEIAQAIKQVLADPAAYAAAGRIAAGIRAMQPAARAAAILESLL